MTYISNVLVAIVGTLVSFNSIAAAEMATPLKWPKPAIVHLRERLQTGKCALASDKAPQKDVCAAYDFGKPTAKSKFKVSQPNESLIILESPSQVIKITRGGNSPEFSINSANLNLKEAKDHSAVKARIQKAMGMNSAKRSLWIEKAYAQEFDTQAIGAVHQLLVETNEMEYCQLLTDFGDRCITGLQNTLAMMDRAAAEKAPKSQAGLPEMMARNRKISKKFELANELGGLRTRMNDQILPALNGYDTVRMCAFQKDMNNAEAIQENAEKKLAGCNSMVKRMELAVGAPGAPNTAEVAEIRKMLGELAGNATALNPSGPADPKLQEATR